MNTLTDENKESEIKNISLESFNDLLIRLSRIVDEPSISFYFNVLFNRIEITIKGLDKRGDISGYCKSFPITDLLTLDMMSSTIDIFEYEYKKFNEMRK